MVTDILPKPVLDNLTGEPTTEYMREFNRAAGAAAWGQNLSKLVEAASFKDDECFDSFVRGWADARRSRGRPAGDQANSAIESRYRFHASEQQKEETILGNLIRNGNVVPGGVTVLPDGLKPSGVFIAPNANPARKDDGGKLPIMQGALARFPRAIAAVAEISQFGAKKYGTYDGWETAENAFTRYRDALHRHEIARLRGERVDPESGLMHLAHFAWGALATLELALREEEKGK